MSDQKLKTLSFDAVFIVANYLLLTNGFTTTLDVKNELRKIGFHAIQEEVSVLVNDFYNQKFIFNFNDRQWVINKSLYTGNGKLYNKYFLVENKKEEEVTEVINNPAVPPTVTTISLPEDKKSAILFLLTSGIASDSYSIAKILNSSGFTTNTNQVRAYIANINR